MTEEEVIDLTKNLLQQLIELEHSSKAIRLLESLAGVSSSKISISERWKIIADVLANLAETQQKAEEGSKS